MKRFSQEIKSGLVWLPELGMGRYPVPKDRPYDADYFSRYQELADTDLGRELTAARIRLVARHYTGPVLDVGIGAGQFVTARPETKGYDVNPAGVEWLKERGAWANLYRDRFPALTFWDSLEHIDRPDVAVARAGKWVFVSVPIFSGAEHIIRSRHFRRDEHIWYWTHDGLVAWFGEQGFELMESNGIETQLGREGIGSYAFARVE
ncbi:methyltransferase domain-containing protein [Enterobacter kobei]|uniref:methyltransferase domain-containing protein n=1 Tax=Enterobacter kobei TaxID=208224 RepID=UPI002A840E42|nr:methyltransferase domain-containing protein [Enterobacter kobei]